MAPDEIPICTRYDPFYNMRKLISHAEVRFI